MTALLVPQPQRIERPTLLVPKKYARGNRSRVDRLPAPLVRRWSRVDPVTMGAAAYSAAGTIGSGSSGTPVVITPTVPACNKGDMLLMPVVGSTSGGTNHITGFTVPSGWTELGNGGLSIRFTSSVIWKISDGTEGGNTVSTGFAFSATTGFATAQVYRITGNDPNASPEAAVILTGSSTTGTVATPYTTGFGNDLLVCITTNTLNNCTFTTISGSTATWTSQHTDGDATRAEAMNIQTTPVPVSGTSVSGGSTTLSLTGTWNSFVFAIRPAPPKNFRAPNNTPMFRGSYY